MSSSASDDSLNNNLPDTIQLEVVDPRDYESTATGVLLAETIPENKNYTMIKNSQTIAVTNNNVETFDGVNSDDPFVGSRIIEVEWVLKLQNLGCTMDDLLAKTYKGNNIFAVFSMDHDVIMNYESEWYEM